jgi:hypothetical protein
MSAIGLSATLAVMTACGTALEAQEPPWSCAFQIQIAGGISPDGQSTANDIHARLGSGIELHALRAFGPYHTIRATFGFTGIRISTWKDTNPNTGEDERDVREYWRNLRLGLEHVVTLPSGGAGQGYFFYGGGLQDSWVARTEGSFLGIALATTLGSAIHTTVDYSYRTYTSSLEAWRGYATAGLGWRFAGATFLELRFVTGPHREFAADGLSTWATGPQVDRRGTLILLGLGIRSDREIRPR